MGYIFNITSLVIIVVEKYTLHILSLKVFFVRLYWSLRTSSSSKMSIKDVDRMFPSTHCGSNLLLIMIHPCSSGLGISGFRICEFPDSNLVIHMLYVHFQSFSTGWKKTKICPFTCFETLELAFCHEHVIAQFVNIMVSGTSIQCTYKMFQVNHGALIQLQVLAKFS